MFEFGQFGDDWPALLCAPVSARDFIFYYKHYYSLN